MPVSPSSPGREAQEKRTYHTPLITIILLTLHLHTQPKPQPPINLNIGHHLGALQITPQPLLIRAVCDNLKQPLPNAPPLRLGTDRHHITEIVSARVVPQSRLRFRLPRLPYEIPPRPQPAPAQVPDVVEGLPEEEGVVG